MLHTIFSQPFLIISIIFCVLLEEIDPLQGLTARFLVGMGLSFLAGFLIGLERESKGKPAGISTHCFVIGGSMIFSYLSAHVDPNSTSRIAASDYNRNWIPWCWIYSKKRRDQESYKFDYSSKYMVFMFCWNGIWIWLFFIGIVAVVFAIFVARIPKITKLGIGNNGNV